MDKKYKVIITGVTGMVGEGVLHECLHHPQIEKILVVGRRPCGIIHPKVTEIVHDDFYDFTSIEDKLTDYDACYFCLGVTSIGKKEPEYFKLTYTLTLAFANVLSKQNPKMTFCYVSGAATDSTEKGNSMWARVKGKTENDLMKLPFKKVFNFRPGFMKATPGLKNTQKYYNYVGWMYPLLKAIMPKFATTLAEVGQAMIEVTLNGYSKNIIEVDDILAINKTIKK